jgi:23S rRNA (guanine2445-N2)-methyltransferase / 23S rRNA (guanine2069-N7)-methyltransferase
MLTRAKACLNESGTVIFSNNKRGFKLDTPALEALGFSIDNITAKTIPEDFARKGKIHQCWTLKS